MSRTKPDRQKFLEIALIIICVGLCGLLYKVGSYRMVVLNLFYLPIVLAAFFLGRYRAGILALLSVVCASVVIALNLNTSAIYTSPLAIGLALTIWGAVTGISAILVGTLSDERMQKIDELHDAYLGVIEVLVRYLNSADPKLKNQTSKLSKMCQDIAVEMRLSDREIDNIRVAALLEGIDSIEITARVIQKAIVDLSNGKRCSQLENTFHGSDLVQSLGSVLTGALPLLAKQDECLEKDEKDNNILSYVEPASGTKILMTVKRYLILLAQDARMKNPRHAISILKNDLQCSHHSGVLHALEQVLSLSPEKPRELEEIGTV